MTYSFKTALAVFAGAATLSLSLAPMALAGSGNKPGLNQVWSRLADAFGELGSVESAEFSADSRYIVTGTKFDYSVRVFRVSDGHQMWENYTSQELERVAWTRSGTQVAGVSEDGLLTVFDAASGDVVTTYQHENGIDGLAASHNGRWMVSGQERVDGVGVGRVFSTADWSLQHTIDFPGTVNEIDFSPDDRFMAMVGDYNARIYDASNWELVHDFPLPRQDSVLRKHIYINTKFSPDGRHLAVGGTHGFVYIFDVEAGELVRRFNKSGQKTETVEWSKDGDFLMVAGHGYTIDAYRVSDLLNEDTNNDSIPHAFQTPVSDALEYMDFNDAGTLLTTAHQDGTVQLWTFMSADPNVNQRRHEDVKRQQDEAAARTGLKR